MRSFSGPFAIVSVLSASAFVASDTSAWAQGSGGTPTGARSVEAEATGGRSRDRAKKAVRKKGARRAATLAPSASPVAPPVAGQSTTAPLRTVEAEAARPRVEERGASIGTRTAISSDALQSSNAQNTYDAIRNVPGVAQADARGGGTADSLQIRGIKLSSTTSYRLDGGLPIVNNINLPMESKQRVEALKGAGALQFGLASPAGIINYVMKRATEKPNFSVSASGNEFGQVIGAVDAGRRFGQDDQFGLRVNVAGGETGSFVKGLGGTRYIGALAADWRPSDRVKFIFDYERFGVDVTEQAALLLNRAVDGKIALPRVPNPKNRLSGKWARSVGEGENIFGRATVDVGAGFSVIGEAGRSEGFRPERAVTQIGSYDVGTGLGTGSVTLIEDQRTVNIYANLAGKHKLSWGPVDNELTIGITENQRKFNNPLNPTFRFPQNIYDPIDVPEPDAPSGREFFPNNSRNFDIYVQNQIDFFDRLHMFGGIRQINYESENANRVGGGTTKTKTTEYAPGAGVVYDVTSKVSVYASYVKSLEESGQAPAQALNAYSVLPPALATQKEIGVRGEVFGATATLGYFMINRANATTNPTTNLFGLNGTNDYKGVEFTLARPITSELSFSTGGQFMRAKQLSPEDPNIDGKTPENTPFFSGNFGLTYKPVRLKGLSLNGGVQYIGEREVNPENQAQIPANWLWNAGANYVTKIRDRRTAFSLNVRNLTNERYFSSAVNGALGVGAPRTISFSMKVDL